MGKSGARRKGGSVLGTPSPKKFKPAKFQEIFDAMKSYKGKNNCISRDFRNHKRQFYVIYKDFLIVYGILMIFKDYMILINISFKLFETFLLV
jgi:hypothetical protein